MFSDSDVSDVSVVAVVAASYVVAPWSRRYLLRRQIAIILRSETAEASVVMISSRKNIDD